MGLPTQIDVRVIAKGGKYLGDDIGGALVTIHDVRLGELLAHGKTSGGSGLPNLMQICLNRSEILPVEGASLFSATLELEEPRLIRITAYGPLAAPPAANTVTQTQWVYPGKNIAGGKGAGFLLEIPGLVVQILNPPTHYLPQTAPRVIDLRVNVTMMCGCPIGKNNPPWDPDEFQVMAMIQGGEYGGLEMPLTWDAQAPHEAPSQFAHQWHVPPNGTAQPQIYAITVSAFQQKTGNTGMDKATVIIPPAATARQLPGTQ